MPFARAQPHRCCITHVDGMGEQACYVIGRRFLLGEGLQKVPNKERAVGWLQRAVNLGSADAAVLLAQARCSHSHTISLPGSTQPSSPPFLFQYPYKTHLLYPSDMLMTSPYPRMHTQTDSIHACKQTDSIYACTQTDSIHARTHADSIHSTQTASTDVRR